MAFDHERKVKTLSSPIEFYLLEVSICYECVMCHTSAVGGYVYTMRLPNIQQPNRQHQ